MMKTLVTTAAAIVLLATTGHAGSKPTLPKEFHGQWCYNQDRSDEGHGVKERCASGDMTIRAYGYSDEDNTCQVLSVRHVPGGKSGTVVAKFRCKGKVRTWENTAQIGLYDANTLFWIIGRDIGKGHAYIQCTGVLVEVDMVERADFPMAVVYDKSDQAFDTPHTCVLDVGRAGHWPLRGACQTGMKCRLVGPYFKKIGNTYYMRTWHQAEMAE